jgi:predicted ATPase
MGQAGERRAQMHLRKILIYPKKFPRTDCYPFNLSLLQTTPFLELTTPITFFVGENATGKSTLMHAVAKQCGIYLWGEDSGRDRCEYNPYERQLFRAVDVEWNGARVPGSFFGSDLFRNYAAIIDEWAKTDPGLLAYYGGKSLVSQSHGQSILSFFKACFKVKGVYFLDEPETGLSPRSQLALLSLLQETGNGGNAQFVIATHSPILLSCPGATLYSFDGSPIAEIRFKDSDYYRVYKEFMISL